MELSDHERDKRGAEMRYDGNNNCSDCGYDLLPGDEGLCQGCISDYGDLIVSTTTTSNGVRPVAPGYEYEHYHGCKLHNVPCCATCCVHVGDCDWGGCHEEAVVVVDCYAYGKIVERRPACPRHAGYGNFKVGYRD